MTDNDALEYIPERFRDSGRGNADAAESAAALARRFRGVTVSSGSFGGAGGAGFAAAVTSAVEGRSKGATRVAEQREDLGHSVRSVAMIGEDSDAAASSALRLAAPQIDRSVADAL